MTLEPASSRSLDSPSGQSSGQSIPADGGISNSVQSGRSSSKAFQAIFAGWICALAFLLAATPARNSDLWLHLASGRLVSEGRLLETTDPFSSTTDGVYWVNHTWLSDLLLYQLYQVHALGEGTLLIVLKASLTALVAALWLCFRRQGEGMGILPLAGFLALLALGPWLLLQASLLSLIGVVLTLYFLERPNLLEGGIAERARAQRWLLVPLFALWANLDSWFLLGPLLVGLYALGELLRWCFGAVSSSNLRSLVLLTLVGLAACLLTPYHYHIFAWPTSLGLTYTEQVLRHDPMGQTLILSPFGDRFATSTVFRSPGAWAYYFLLAGSAASFFLSMRLLHPGRLLVWLVLAALSVYQARTIPFFAVAAAPLLALNVQEWARHRVVSERPHRWQTIARTGGVLAGLVLLVLAWPGWLQPAPYQPRGWGIVPDDSLVRLTRQVSRWHADGRFASDRFALTFSPEVAHYLAWFCPQEKGFLDSRWALFDRVADDYLHMRRNLLQADAGAEHDLLSLLAVHRIDRILLYDPDWERTARAYRHLFLAAPDWELLAVEGGATLFHRREAAPSPNAFNYRRAAYHSSSDRRAVPVPHSPRTPRWFDAFLRHPNAHSADRKEAALHLLSFDLLVQQQYREGLSFQAAGLVSCGSVNEPTTAASLLAMRLQFTPSLSVAPEPLLLAVRAARLALAVHPEDAGAFLLLGEAYFRLSRQTSERRWEMRLPELAPLRRTQILTALEQAVLLDPELDQAHALLAQLYVEERQLDRCLDHLRARLRIAEKKQRDAAFADALRHDVTEMEKLVNQAEKTYQANLPGKTDPSKVLLRAELAARNGLSHKALRMLLESSPAVFGRPGVEYELDLMINAGQSYQVRDWLEPGYESKIDFDRFHRVKARAAASCGAYEEADAELDRGSEPLRRVPLLPKLTVSVRSAIAFQAARAVLARSLAAETIFEAWHPLGLLTDHLRQEANRRVLRGLLALESGAVETAQQHFRAALDIWGNDNAAMTGAGLDFPARPIAQELLRRLQE